MSAALLFFELAARQTKAYHKGPMPVIPRYYGIIPSEVDLFLVGFAAAALAFTPCGGFVSAFVDQFGRVGKILSGFPGRVIRGEREYLVFGKVQGFSIETINNVVVY
jgi:hypothetical protein